MKHRITIGIPSIILIFMILCLAVFSLLSLSDAKSALTFAQKRADTVQMYYEADASAQTFVRDYRAAYSKEDSQVSADHETKIIGDFPMRSGQILHVEMSVDGSQIFAYNVYNNTDYVIDSDLPVWGGE